jgi:Zn-dependent peptidase ImmA (M78 family)
LAHLLSGTGGIDGPTEKYIGQLRGRNKKIEVLCSQFAGVFLVPDEYFGDHIDKLSFDEDRIKEIAGEYKVSPEVILRRLLDKNLVTPDYYGQLVAKWRRIKPKRRDGGDYYRTKGVYLGERYLELVFSRFYHREISIDQVADYLGVKVSGIPNMEELIMPKDMVA